MPKIILASRCAWTLYNFRAGLMHELKRKGWTVLGGGAGGDGFEARIDDLGVPFTALPIQMKGMNPFSDFRLLLFFWRWYRREKPDMVHHFTIKPVIYGSIAARLAGVPRIINTITGLGFVFTKRKGSFLGFLVERLYRASLGCAHHVFFQNSDDQQLFLKHQLVALGKADLLPGSGVDLNYFAPCARGKGDEAKGESGRGNNQKEQTEKAICFLMVARLLRDKGIHEYVEAARLVKTSHARARFQILGARDERNPTVISQTELDGWQAEGVVKWLGFVKDVRPVLADADVVVLPSYREGTPRSLLEAAAMAKPIIATNVVGCREVVEDGVNGLLVPVKDVAALAQAMIRMIENPDIRERMGRAGQTKVAKEFDERLVIEKILAVYQEVRGESEER